MDPLISIIVPVYNVEKYLPRCLDSLACQTLKEIEIILVDDGSTDNSGDLCDRYAEKDPRFRVIHQDNRGLSAARNRGIDDAAAKYIMLVDSDDWVDPEYCRQPYQIAELHHVDMVMFRSTAFIDQHKPYQKKHKKNQKQLPAGLISKASAMSLIHNRQIGVTAWNKLYRKELFLSVRYPEGKVHEDTGTTYRLVHAASSFYCLDIPLYCHSIRPGSITTAPSLSSLTDRLQMALQELHDLEEWGYIKKDTSRYRTRLFSIALFYLMHAGRFQSKSAECSSILHSVSVFSTNLSVRKKMLICLFRFSPAMFDRICDIRPGRSR